ncbi:MAG: hypothetical protein QHC40_08945 [Sphingobium sp.]|nr:hypothetical protein [Sphingobium sp.]
MRPLLCLPLLLAACSDSRDVMDELPNSSIAGAARENVAESRMEAPLARPVTIGEDGSRMDACGAIGRVLGSGRALPLRAAPFDDARVLRELAEGDRLHVCTRSLDQRWLGVVVPPAVAADGKGADAVDCEVTSPVDRKQAYAGPCASGWVSSARVRLVAS